MDAEKQLPPTLLQQLNDDGELLTFNSWTGTLKEGGLGMALPIEKHSIYEKQTASFVKTLGANDFGLRAALAEYIHQHDTDTFWETFNMATVTWEEVTGELEKVEAIYQDKGTGNPIRRAFRRSAAYTNTATDLLEAIPNDDGLGLLKGALLVVLKATERRSQVCERIFRCFRDVPEIVQEANRKQKLFPMDVNLFGLANSLYRTLFECIPLLIQILLRDSSADWYKRAGKAIKGTLGDQLAEVDGVLQKLTTAQRSLQQAFSGLEEERDAGTYKIVSATKTEVGIIRHNQHQHHHELMNEVRVIKDDMEDLKLVCRELVQQNPVLNSIHILTAEHVRKRYKLEGHGTDSMLSFSDQRDQGLDIDHALAMLYRDQEAVAHRQDLCTTLRKHHDFTDKALAQPSYLANTNRFRHWLVHPHSDILLVDGHVGSQTSGRTSPMSVFCATLAQTLLEHAKTATQHEHSEFVLYHFCGLHHNRSGNLEGPLGLIRSLLGQLLQAWPRDSPPDAQFETSLQGVGSGNTELEVRAACKVFQMLISTLPHGTTIHCIIDGISEFDTKLWERSRYLNLVVDCLRASATSSGTLHKQEAHLKVLMTSADSSSKAMRESLARDHQISLRAGEFLSQPARVSNVTNIPGRRDSEDSFPWRHNVTDKSKQMKAQHS
ncbi:hypothetical protein F5883DRAFT_429860 [Diaporthe sp. PMI_573]|nr:hypothetical protein F5883DRAFT_429860 [Diaporthaceae sp. PMI_573]